MNDQIPADQVRKIIARYRDGANDQGGRILADLKDLLPPPTLADMTTDERDECRGMQADLAQGDRVVILDGHPGLDGRALVLESSLDTFRPTPQEVTPRPDLDHLEWPAGDKKPAPAPAPALPDGWRLAKHQTRGPVIVTRPEPDDDGEVCFVATAVGFLGYVCCFCDPDELTYIDTEPEADQ